MSVESFSQVADRDVVASDNAESIGSVKGFVLDGQGRAIEGIYIAGRGRKSTILDWSHVTAFGADVVMARTSSVSTGVADEHQRSAVKGDVTLIGSRVLTVDGEVIGEVSDVQFDTESGAIVNVATDRESIESSAFRSLGSFALVVDRPRSGP